MDKLSGFYPDLGGPNPPEGTEHESTVHFVENNILCDDRHMASLRNIEKEMPLDYIKKEFGHMNPILFWGAEQRAFYANRIFGLAPQGIHSMNCLRISMAEFIDHYLDAIQTGDMHTFRRRFRSASTILVYDVDLLKLKEFSQIAFYHLLVHMFKNNRQVILTSRKHPTKLGLIEELETMCLGGLVVNV